MDTKPIRILLIEDNAGDARLIQEQLKDVPEITYILQRVSQLQEGLSFLNKNETDVVLSDLSLPDSPGLETFKRLQMETPKVPVVVVTGFDNESAALDAVREGAQDYLIKGQVDARGLSRTILYAIERHRTQATLRSLSLTDELTGLYNRRGFMTLGEQALKSALRAKSALYLYYADLDGLKQINDSFGHPDGDSAISGAAEVLRKTFRQSDIVARMGGDEFAILAAEDQNRGTDIIISRLHGNLAHYNLQNPHAYKISLSIGVAQFNPKAPVSIEELIGQADKTLYVSKKGKKAISQSSPKAKRLYRWLGATALLALGILPLRWKRRPAPVAPLASVPMLVTPQPAVVPRSHGRPGAVKAASAPHALEAAAPDLSSVPAPAPTPVPAAVETSPAPVQITHFAYVQTIMQPGTHFTFQIIGSGFTPKVLNHLTIYFGTPHIQVNDLRLATRNELRGEINVHPEAPTQYVFPHILIDETSVFQAPNPFAVIRPGDVLDILFTKMDENGHAGHFRVYTNLDTERARQFHLIAGAPNMEISPLEFNLPYRVDGVLRINDSLAHGDYSLSAFLGAKEVFRKDHLIEVTRPMIGSSGYVQKMVAQTLYRRPGDMLELVIQGSGFTPGLADLLKGRVDGLSTKEFTVHYLSPGRLTASFQIPQGISEKSYSITLYKGPEVVYRQRDAFRIIPANWMESFEVTPLAKPGQKCTLRLKGRNFSPAFLNTLHLEADEAGIHIASLSRRDDSTLEAPMDIDYAVTPGNYMITLKADGNPITLPGGNLITISAAEQR